uniref:protein FAR1-RELATED SEQUENCE 5-like n=1 Tax=Erigeron canadensis TaxID=72917 RepID=UPI001CB973AF|nr:protein FAR1-RELATED SEQUENCE 5-like [Erigeron canadensis]
MAIILNSNSIQQNSEINHQNNAFTSTDSSIFDSYPDNTELTISDGETVEYIPRKYTVGKEIKIEFGSKWIPECADEIKPSLGMEFGCIDEAFNFYSQYALSSGFEPRRFSHRTAKDDFGVEFVKYKWIVCSREGSKRKRRSDSKQSRNRPTQRTSCEACIRIVFNVEGRYSIYHFEEMHNHFLVHPDFRKHLKSCRSLDYSKQVFLHHLTEASIGPSVGYRILTKIHGGHEAVGASKTDCLFWADEVSKLNYYAFGDVVSFDATYRTNKYDMVFIPFTRIDNHKKCVTFGGGMLAKEDISSYKWLLDEFKNAFPREPKVVLTDQDPSMKVAVSDVFKTARHRLCMWHIMEKVSVKVSHSILKSGLRGDLSKIVWTDKINKEEFDKQWLHVLTKYDADENKWLNDMYKLRYNWIPAYFQDWEMSGLMRTSSRCESENHMFQKLMNSSSTLIEFYTHFDTAMQSQRWVQSENDQKSMYTTLDLATEYALERHAHTLFTHDVILDIQKEMCEAFKHCLCFNVSYLTDGSKTFSITDTSVKSYDIDDSIDRDANPNILMNLFIVIARHVISSFVYKLLCFRNNPD